MYVLAVLTHTTSKQGSNQQKQEKINKQQL